MLYVYYYYTDVRLSQTNTWRVPAARAAVAVLVRVVVCGLSPLNSSAVSYVTCTVSPSYFLPGTMLVLVLPAGTRRVPVAVDTQPTMRTAAVLLVAAALTRDVDNP